MLKRVFDLIVYIVKTSLLIMFLGIGITLVWGSIVVRFIGTCFIEIGSGRFYNFLTEVARKNISLTSNLTIGKERRVCNE